MEGEAHQVFTQAKEQQGTCSCWQQGRRFGLESQDPSDHSHPSHLCPQDASCCVFSCKSRKGKKGAGSHRKMVKTKEERHYSCSEFEMCCFESSCVVGEATVPCSTSGLLRRIFFPSEVMQPYISWSGLLPLGKQTHSSAFQLNARSKCAW